MTQDIDNPALSGGADTALLAGLGGGMQSYPGAQPPQGLPPGFESQVGRLAPMFEPSKQMAGLLTQQEQLHEQTLRAEQQQKVTEAAGIDAAATKYGQTVKEALSTYRDEMGKMPLPAFVPSKESAGDLSMLGSLVALVGFMVGKNKGMQPGMNALAAMTGMMKGYTQGRLDLYKREKDAFDENFRRIQTAHEEYQQELKDALEISKSDLQEGMAKAKLAAIKAGDEITSKLIAEGRLQPAIELAQARQQAMEKAATLLTGLYSKQTARGSQLRSALNERLEQNVIRSGAEAARSIEMLQKSGVTTGVGVLGLVTGEGTIPSEAAAALASKVTPEEQKQYASALRGLALELASTMTGGYRVNQQIVNDLLPSIAARPGDSYATAGYKMLNAIAKFKVGIQYSLAYSPEQQAQKQQVLQSLAKYPTPEQFLEKFGGKRVFRDELEAAAKAHGDNPDDVFAKYQDNGYVIEDRLPEIGPDAIDPSDPNMQTQKALNMLDTMGQ